MKRLLVTLGIAGVAASGAVAAELVPVDFPTSNLGETTFSQREALAYLVTLYRNNVVLLSNPSGSYSEAIQKTVPNPAIVSKLTQLAGANGPVSLTSLTEAVSALVAANPSNAPEIVASALSIAKGLPGNLNTENRVAIGKAALRALPPNLPDGTRIVALIIGVSAYPLAQMPATYVVRTLRDYVLNDLSGSLLASLSDGKTYLGKNAVSDDPGALNLDRALINQGIISPFDAGEDFALLRNFLLTEQLPFSFYGSNPMGPLFSPGGPGSPGDPGNPGPQFGPTPTPTPKPGPTPPPPPPFFPTPTPTPTPFPAS